MLKHLFLWTPRASRAEFIFWGIIFQIITSAYMLFQLSMPVSPTGFSPSMLLLLLVQVLMLPIYFAIGWMWIVLLIRRLHDINLSGWWVLLLMALGFIVGVISLVMPSWYGYITMLLGLAVMGFLAIFPGSPTTNKYGEVPTKIYAPQFLTNKNNLTISTVVFLILLVGCQFCNMWTSQRRLQEARKIQQQYLEKMSHSQENF